MPEELTYRQRTLYGDDVVTAEMKRLGIPTGYPDDSSFSEDEITEAVSKLGDYERYADVATLVAGDYSSDVITAFAKLAFVLHSQVTTRYGEMKVRRERTDEEKRSSALANLKSRLSQSRKDEAIRSLMARRHPFI